MKKVVAGLLAALLLAPAGSIAQESAFPLRADAIRVADRSSSLNPLREAAIREAARLAAAPPSVPQPQPPASQRSWAGRHPVLVGMLAGAGAGAVVFAAAHPEDRALDERNGYMAAAGAGVGAAFGAMGGWLFSVVWR